MLVLGYGSDLRRDDAAGRRAAEALAARDPAGVEVRVVHQLAPELAAACAGRRLVVFVDAAVDLGGVRVEAVDPRAAGPVTTHHVHPRSLLGLAARLGWAPDAAVTVSVPAADLGLGTELSPRTQVAVGEAADRLAELCAEALAAP